METYKSAFEAEQKTHRAPSPNELRLEAKKKTREDKMPMIMGFMRFRQLRGVLHLLTTLFALGYLGGSARVCIVSAPCGARLAVVVGLSALGVVVSLVLAAALLGNCAVMARLEWVFDMLLIGLWGAVVGLSFVLLEGSVAGAYGSALLAFSWLALLFVCVAWALAFLFLDGPVCCGKRVGAKYRNAEEEEGANTKEQDDADDPERDATPEIAYVPLTDAAQLQEEGAV